MTKAYDKIAAGLNDAIDHVSSRRIALKAAELIAASILIAIGVTVFEAGALAIAFRRDRN